MEYKIFKLKSGEEIISEVKELSKGKYIIERPMIFKTTTMFDNLGRPYDLMMLKDWLVHSDTKIIELPKSHVATSFYPTMDTQKMYDLEKNRMDKGKKQVPPSKTKATENILEQLFGDIFNDIQKEVETQTNEEMKKINDDSILPFTTEEYPFDHPIVDKTPKGDMIPMVSIKMLFPPEVILDLLDSGLLDPKELLRLVRKIERMSGRRKAKKKPLFPKMERLSESEKKLDDESAGCNWKDWPENVWDLLDNEGITGA